MNHHRACGEGPSSSLCAKLSRKRPLRLSTTQLPWRHCLWRFAQCVQCFRTPLLLTKRVPNSALLGTGPTFKGQRGPVQKPSSVEFCPCCAQPAQTTVQVSVFQLVEGLGVGNLANNKGQALAHEAQRTAGAILTTKRTPTPPKRTWRLAIWRACLCFADRVGPSREHVQRLSTCPRRDQSHAFFQVPTQNQQ